MSASGCNVTEWLTSLNFVQFCTWGSKRLLYLRGSERILYLQGSFQISDYTYMSNGPVIHFVFSFVMNLVFVFIIHFVLLFVFVIHFLVGTSHNFWNCHPLSKWHFVLIFAINFVWVFVINFVFVFGVISVLVFVINVVLYLARAISFGPVIHLHLFVFSYVTPPLFFIPCSFLISFAVKFQQFFPFLIFGLPPFFTRGASFDWSSVVSFRQHSPFQHLSAVPANYTPPLAPLPWRWQENCILTHFHVCKSGAGKIWSSAQFQVCEIVLTEINIILTHFRLVS